MKQLTIAFAATALFALAGCNGQEAANEAETNEVSGSIGNAVAPAGNAAAPPANVTDGGKPVDGAAPATVPAGDKPTDGAAPPPAGDKPTQ